MAARLLVSFDYDTYPALVEGLERYNGDGRGKAYDRLGARVLIEEAGLPLQARLVSESLGARKAAILPSLAFGAKTIFQDQLSCHLPFLNRVGKTREGQGG